jgi:hypothetical protein
LEDPDPNSVSDEAMLEYLEDDNSNQDDTKMSDAYGTIPEEKDLYLPK